jgi:AcrR family transcriptional regulator
MVRDDLAADRMSDTVPNARQRIVDAGIQCVVRDGTADSSMASIAGEAGVSKALLHYHFADREHLLATVVTTLAERIVTREHGAFAADPGASPVDILWLVVDAELQRGELRALLALGMLTDEAIRDAVQQAHDARRIAAAHTVDILFTRLDLIPRLGPGAIADTFLAFVDGLALSTHLASREPRVSFDVFWLAALSLAD